MDRTIQKTLILLGLDLKEIKFYETCVKLGPATINEVAKQSRLQRSTAYLIAQNLSDKGFVEEDLTGYKKKIFTIEPKKLLQLLASKQRVLRRQELELKENLPELQTFYNQSEIRPKVKVYEGNNGLLKVWKDILSTKGEVLIWTNQQTDNLVFGQEKHVNFIQERVRKGIKARVLAMSNKEGKELQKLDSKSLRETKLLPQSMNFSAETYIYDNKMAILDYNRDIIGVIVESVPMVQSHKAVFELIWTLI